METQGQGFPFQSEVREWEGKKSLTNCGRRKKYEFISFLWIFFLNRVIDDFFFPNSQIVECRNGGLSHDERESEHASKVSN